MTARAGARQTWKLSMRCSCGDSMTATISPAVAAHKIRDVFLAVHKGGGHVVTDRSTRPSDQSDLLRGVFS